jgi:hypothetical protein
MKLYVVWKFNDGVAGVYKNSRNALIECNKLNKDEFGNGYEKTKKTHIIIADN